MEPLQKIFFCLFWVSTAYADPVPEATPPETPPPAVENARAEEAKPVVPPAAVQPVAVPPVAAPSAHVATAKPAPAAPPYSLPWQLRSVVASSVVRSDTATAIYNNPTGDTGVTVASMLLVSYKVTRSFAPFARVGSVTNWPPKGDSETAIVNPAIGGTYSFNLPKYFKLGLFLGVALPFGRGGGNTPNAAVIQAVKSGVLARSAMDNAMFAVNYFTLFPGLDLAFVYRGFTAQAEVTVLELVRVRGATVDPDISRTNMTMGLHLGYFFIPQLSIGTELRYQVWLSTPAPVAADKSGASRDNVTLAVGLRGHFKTGPVWLRPGIAYARGLDDPMSAQNYNIVQVDLPIAF